jgi:hypothetical protein
VAGATVAGATVAGATVAGATVGVAAVPQALNTIPSIATVDIKMYNLLLFIKSSFTDFSSQQVHTCCNLPGKITPSQTLI